MSAPPPFVEVIWNDAWANPTNEVTVEDAHKMNGPVQYRTRGWLISDDAVQGVLLCPEENMEEYETYRGPMMIPRGMVESVTELVVRRKGAKKVKGPSHDGASSPVMPDPHPTLDRKDTE
jgi:hypothetical protein